MKKENVFQFIIVIVGIFSIIVNFRLFGDWRGIFYYTIISNIYVTIFYMAVLILKCKNKLLRDTKYYVLKGMMLVSILCTMLIYFGIINSNESVYVGHQFECNMVHLVMPILTLIECILYKKGNMLRYRYTLIWGSAAVVYLSFLVLYRKLLNGTFLNGKKYPYSIIDFEKYGVAKCLINCLLIFAVFLIIGIIVVFFDNKMECERDGDA